METHTQQIAVTGTPHSPPTSSTPLSMLDRAVDKLLGLMVGWYGTKFSEQWAGVDRQVMRTMWVKGLSGFSMDEIARGVEACRLGQKWPPTLPEFLMLCRPPLNYERAYLEACEQSAARDAGSRESWSSPAIFWAIGEMGGDVRVLSYRSIEARWKYALDKALADVAEGRRGAIPPRPLAIAQNPKAAAPMPDNLRALFRKLTDEMKAVRS